MGIWNLMHFYRVRLRHRLLGEGFALVGIAAGVALLFASQVASESLTGSAARLNSGIVGAATLQVSARGPEGFPEQMLSRIRSIGGVRRAAPLFEVNAQAVGPKGRESVQLVGADGSLAGLGGQLVAHTKLRPFGGIGAVVLPAPLARKVGVTKFGNEVTVRVNGRSSRAPLYKQLRRGRIGGLVDSPIVVAPLFYAQQLAGLRGRITRVLVQPAAGRREQVRAELTRLVAGTAGVQSADYDDELFANAAAASSQSTSLFALIGALVGFLFAFNAVLLTVPGRRRLIADLRRCGYGPRAVLGVVGFDAVALGVGGCVVGLAIGEELSRHLVGANPGYLSSAFAVGSARVVGAMPFVIAIAGGLVAALVAVVAPLRAALSSMGASPAGHRSRHGVAPAVALAGLACLAGAVAILAFAPQEAIWGMVCLAAALLLLLGTPLGVAVWLLGRAAGAVRGLVGHVTVMELRSGRPRALAVAATGAVAVFAGVAIQGAHGDLLAGLDAAAHDMNSTTDLWVAPAGSFDLLMTQPFDPEAGEVGKLRELPGVDAVRTYHGALLDWGAHRTWVISQPVGAGRLIPPSQVLEGNLSEAEQRLREGGWATLSLALASSLDLQIGDSFTLPSPHPLRLRLALITTNIGWAPGAIILPPSDYARGWPGVPAAGGAGGGGPVASAAPTVWPAAYSIILEHGGSPDRVRGEVAQALGSPTGLAVQTASRHAARQRALSRQGLSRLTEITTLILVAAILAIAAATAAMIHQRRPRLAKLKLDGVSRRQLWATLILESLLVLAAGCLTGAVLGLVGQQLLDHALARTINYPVVTSVAIVPAIVSAAAVTVLSGAIIAIPGYRAARVDAALALQE